MINGYAEQCNIIVGGTFFSFSKYNTYNPRTASPAVGTIAKLEKWGLTEGDEAEQTAFERNIRRVIVIHLLAVAAAASG